MEINKAEVANRLKQWAAAHYKMYKDMADDLDMTPQALQSSYLNGRSLPGAEILIKLQNLGLDITWLLTGKTLKETLNKRITDLEGERNYWKGEYEKLSSMINKIVEQSKKDK
jgi:transcriptional regulator with XRE-family HTH domain